MFRTDVSTAAAEAPTPSAAGTPGFFTGGTPGSVDPTVVDADWLNTVQEELMAPVLAAGIAPSKTMRNQVLAALQAMFGGVVGSMRKGAMYLAAAAATASFTADEIIVETALGGAGRFCLANYAQTVNLATTGAGGMDTGAAPASGFVALYAIYDPATGTASILAVNATAAGAPNVYGGAHMPAGFTASALISVWPTNGSGQLVAGVQRDRTIGILSGVALSTATPQASLTQLSIASIVPANARTVSGNLQATSTAASNLNLTLSPGPAGLAEQSVQVDTSGAGGGGGQFRNLPIVTAQTLYYQATSTAGTPSFTIWITGYEI